MGQHFLHDESICVRIVESLPNNTIRLLEVGPGGGAITKYLIQNDYDFRCVEFDKEKVEYLYKTYPLLKDKIIQGDFLKIEQPFQDAFTVIGNFPYNISSQIVFKIIDWRHLVPVMLGMFQKEVAIRIAAKHGNKDYGILSILVQCFYDVEYLFEVGEHCFTPSPKVKSAVIRLVRKPDVIEEKYYAKFKAFIKTAFNQRRKTLRNGLKSITAVGQLNEPIFDKRAEQLSVAEFVQLFHQLFIK